MWTCTCGFKCADDHNFCEACGKKKPATGDAPWYYIEHGERVGPVSLAEARIAIEEDRLTKDSLVWQRGYSSWIPAQNTILKQYLNEHVPQVGQKNLHDKWLWCLATIPITVNLILFQLIRPYEGDIGDLFITAVVFGLNTLFMILDNRYLKKAGYHMKKVLYLGFVLIPVYLFVRPAKTNKHFWPGIVWCLMFILQLLPIW